ncbi:MAG: hypothetical protein EOM07_12565 [Clostridia bacterium]|nr:hypothetical protein [Clostridia bacterium]
MAQVTMELRTVLQMTDFNLFDFDYECDDLTWKAKLEQQFIDTYYFNEIGQETIDRWKHHIRTKFQSIMPYYNKLYNTTLMEINPLITKRETETYEGDNASAGLSSSTDNSKNFDYPQNANPATDIASSMDDNQGTLETSGNSSMNYERIMEGFEGNQSELLKSYRENILRINTMIMKECKDLFILIY